jgi:hypothetical protein
MAVLVGGSWTVALARGHVSEACDVVNRGSRSTATSDDVVRREVKPKWIARSGNVGCYPTLILIPPTFPLKTYLGIHDTS